MPILLILIVSFAFVIYTSILDYKSEGVRSTELTIISGVSPNKFHDRVDVLATVLSINPLEGKVALRLEFTVTGKFADKHHLPTQDIHVATNTSQSLIVLEKGNWLMPYYVDVKLFNGVVADYPFDSHIGVIELYSYIEDKNSGEFKPVPIRVGQKGYIPGFKIASKGIEPSDEYKNTYAGIVMTITRAKTTKAVAIFIIVMLWLMTFSIMAVTISMIFFGRPLEFSSFAWIGAMLFAFFSFRMSAPDIPPIGGYFDFISFFWCLILVSMCLVGLVIKYLLDDERRIENEIRSKESRKQKTVSEPQNME